ncbi:Type 1 glutamine amidotransferase-like domain-containing protein [Acetobacteraceae bacterium]|nr:Type 1 glutamine amidotransferase-like domain-containing protein [Candidatus Parcubacteria bacterium]
MKAFLYSHYLEQKHFDALRKLLGKSKASKALFIITAAVPYGLDPRPVWLDESLVDMRQFAEKVDEITFEGEPDLKDLSQYDFIFVSGGNAFYLAYRLAETSMDEMLKKYITNGGIYCGSSAGGVILMDNIEHFTPVDDATKAPAIYPGLGLIDFAFIPHADNKKYAEGMRAVADKYEQVGKEVILVNDNQAVIIDGSKRELV